MDISTLLGLLVGFGALITSVLMEGGSPAAFIAPSAILIVLGGTFGATLISFPLDIFMKLPGLLGITMKQQKHDVAGLVEQSVALAEKARKQGLLSLEADAQQTTDPFLRQAIMLAVDGTDAEVLKGILETQVEHLEERHEVCFSMFEAMGGFAPTMGIIGTVMGLVHVLGNLSNPNSLGPKIAVAFIATLWGVATANLLWLPLGAKLKRKSKDEVFFRTVAIEGILAVQSGENPRIVRQKLEGMVAQDKKKGAAKDKAADGARQDAA